MLQRRRRAGQGESWPCHQANRNRTAFGADCANPATISGALHPEPAGGSTGPQERIIVSSILNRETAFSACDHRGIEGGHPAARSWRPLGRRRSRVGAAVAALDDVRRRPEATGLDVAGDGNRQPVLAPLRWQPRARLPLMAFGMLALLGALAGGLVRLGWSLPVAPSLVAFHGPLMVSGFLGTVIGQDAGELRLQVREGARGDRQDRRALAPVELRLGRVREVVSRGRSGSTVKDRR